MNLFNKTGFFKLKRNFAMVLLAFLCLNIMIPDSFALGEEKVYGEYCYHYGDNESLTQAKETCKKMALKKALESALLYVSSEIRINEAGLENMDIHSQALGCLEDVKILEERVKGNEICYRLQAVADVSLLEKKLEDIIRSAVIKPGKKIRIAFYNASIDEERHFSRDDTNPAPDAYVMVKDKYGNDVFRSGHYYLNQKKYGRLIKNRNNYNPDFEGANFSYVLDKDAFLSVQLYDWDGIEGRLGTGKSPDDPIGQPCRIDVGQPLGKRWIKGKDWKLEMEILESNE
ncbi:hypothetical protein C6A36_00635 [Desulfobacteraceae bacterium SEEP-SAG10]|nr:hypothetical protein C6A36_00635 [Desulfobacteraceae bacterium SEEP-SAG10]